MDERDLFAEFGHSTDLARPVADEARTLGDVLRARAAATPNKSAHFRKQQGHKQDGGWQRTTWSEAERQARCVSRGLVDLGIEVGDRVSILGPTSVAWADYDFGAQLAGATSIGIYPLQTPEQVRYLLEHSESRIIFVADEHELVTVLEAAKGIDSLRAIVPWDETLLERFGDADARLVSPERFRGEPLDIGAVDERLAKIDPESPAILIYTSGTTGPPKGAMITHNNILALLRHGPGVFPFRDDDLLLAFLPMAHATERVLSFYLRVANGVAAGYASSIGAVLEEVREIRPTVFGSVPRLFEKAYAKIQSELAKKPAVARSIFSWATGVGRERAARILANDGLAGESPGLTFRDRLAHRLVFRKIHDAFGGRVRACITGAAPISRDILEFFWAVGLPIYEAYGMTEATVLTHINRPGETRLGTVGRVVPVVDQRIADDGEVLLRGPIIFKGYFKNDAATRETLVDGWLHSGDIGSVDDDGYLRITDRKKHLIITAGGKNVAPANIERAIKNQSPFISQVHAHGDRRNFISALIAPSPLETLEWGRDRGLVTDDEVERHRRELMANPAGRSEDLNEAMARIASRDDFRALFLEPVRRGNAELARVERVRRFVVLERDFSQEGGELTPTMKLKRKAVEEKYADLLDRIYEDDDFGLDASAE